MVTRINRSEIRDPKFDRLIGKKIQVLGLLGHLSSSITRFPLNAYQTVSLTVTLLTSVMRILILRWASHLDAFSGYPLHT